jgi:enterochelin esterase family protein
MRPTSDTVGDHRQKWSSPGLDRTAATARVRALRPPNVTMVSPADVEHAHAALARDAGVGVTEIVIAGLSLSGLAAAYAATRYPTVFRAAVCQSPSFWWEQGRFAEELPAATPAGPEFWISVGSRETEAGMSHPPSGLRQELTQVAGCVSAAAAMRTKGYSVSYREYDGVHDPDCWREDLSLALLWVWRRR